MHLIHDLSFFYHIFLSIYIISLFILCLCRAFAAGLPIYLSISCAAMGMFYSFIVVVSLFLCYVVSSCA
jgi:hypothetical protein